MKKFTLDLTGGRTSPFELSPAGEGNPPKERKEKHGVLDVAEFSKLLRTCAVAAVKGFAPTWNHHQLTVEPSKGGVTLVVKHEGLAGGEAELSLVDGVPTLKVETAAEVGEV